MIDCLNNQSLAFFLLQNGFHREFNILTFFDVRQVGCNAIVVGEDLLKKVVESLDYLKIALFKGFVKF